MPKTKLSNAELDTVKERLFEIIKSALAESGEDIDFATSYGKNTMVLNMPYAEQGIEGVFEIAIINKTEPTLDLYDERERFQQLKIDRARKAEENARKSAENKRKAEEKARAKAEREANETATE